MVVSDVMINLPDVYMLDEAMYLDRDMLEELVLRGYSRVPVYRGSRGNVVGVLLIKTLVRARPAAALRGRPAC